MKQSSEKYSAADFSSHLFWDVNRAKLDLEKNKNIIVERVLQRGSRSDLNLLLSYYDKEDLKEIIKQLTWLNEKDRAFVHVFFDIPYNELKCYTKKPSSHYY